MTDPVRRPLTGYMPFVVVTKAMMRRFLTSRPAIALSLHHRRLAAADPALEWDAATHSYRRKRRTPPAPPETTPRDAEGPGGENVPAGLASRPAAARNKNANMDFCPGEASGAHARGRSRGRARGDDA